MKALTSSGVLDFQINFFGRKDVELVEKWRALKNELTENRTEVSNLISKKVNEKYTLVKANVVTVRSLILQLERLCQKLKL